MQFGGRGGAAGCGDGGVGNRGAEWEFCWGVVVFFFFFDVNDGGGLILGVGMGGTALTDGCFGWRGEVRRELISRRGLIFRWVGMTMAIATARG